MKIDFIVPAYNEEKLLEKNILKLYDFLKKENYKFDWQIKIIINGSNDKSEEIAKKIEGPHIKYQTIKERGKGKAIKTAILNSLADYIVYMDIDLAVALEDINTLLSPENLDYDLIIGSRLLPQSKRERSKIKDLSSKIYILLSKVILKHKFSDLQCGFKAVKRGSYNKIKDYLQDNNWFFDTELLIFSNFFNLKIKEIPVNWSENRYEKRKSKVKLFRDSIKFIKNLIKLKKGINKLK